MLLLGWVLGDAAARPGRREPAAVSGFQPEPRRQGGLPSSRPCCHPDSHTRAPDRSRSQPCGGRMEECKSSLMSQSCCCVPALCVEHTPSQGPRGRTQSPPEGMAAPSPGLASMPGSQNRPPDLTARSAQDSLAPGPELRSLESGADQAHVGTTPWVSSTRDSLI